FSILYAVSLFVLITLLYVFLIIVTFSVSSLFFMLPTPIAFFTLSLHDALPISPRRGGARSARRRSRPRSPGCRCGGSGSPVIERSEEHTSELQSRFDLVCRLLLEKKKIIYNMSVSHIVNLLFRLVAFQLFLNPL